MKNDIERDRIEEYPDNLTERSKNIHLFMPGVRNALTFYTLAFSLIRNGKYSICYTL